jgi:hypothetical protein
MRGLCHDIVIENCDNVTVTANDFTNVVGAIYALNSTNITVTWTRPADEIKS